MDYTRTPYDLTEDSWQERKVVYEQMEAAIRARFRDETDWDSQWEMERMLDEISLRWRRGVSTSLNFDLPTNCIQPIEELRASYEQMCERYPSYLGDFELHVKYQKQLAKWRPLIESNNWLIYSDWDRLKPSEYVNWTTYDYTRTMIQGAINSYCTAKKSNFNYQQISDLSIEEIASQSMQSSVVRYEAIKMVFEAYQYFIEQMDEPKTESGKVRFVSGILGSKREVILFFEGLDKKDINPFDYLYWSGMFERARKNYGTNIFLSDISNLIVMTILMMLLSMLFMYGEELWGKLLGLLGFADAFN